MRRPLVAGNWKMNTTRESGQALAAALASGVGAATDTVDVLVCPPFPYLTTAVDAVGTSGISVGAQDAYFEAEGAFTGEISNGMLKDVGCTYIVLGHSERRHVLGECDEITNKKVSATLGAGLKPILCVGELLEEREADKTESVLDRQMAGGLAGIDAGQMAEVVIAYEPVWAIGTGKTASPEQAESVHAHLRKWLESNYNADVAAATRILYGGSVKPANAAELIGQPNVDGALVGGASLKAELFLPIIEAAAGTVA